VAATGVYPAWTIDPSDSGAQNHTGTVKFAVNGIPDVTYTVAKTANDGRSVRLRYADESGDWLTAATPFGGLFGPTGPGTTPLYLSMGANWSGTSTRVTATFTFASPMPAGVLGIAIGDVDVEDSTLKGVGAAGQPIPGAGIQGSVSSPPFNFCDVPAPAPSACDGETDFPLPTWTPSPTDGGDLNSKRAPGVNDSEGASAWFRPSTGSKSYTFSFSGVSGAGSSHSIRLWLAALKGNITGRVTIRGGGRCSGCTVQLYAPGSRKPSRTTRTDSSGAYGFPNWAATSGYKVVLIRPGGYSVVGSSSKSANIASRDAVVNFELVKNPPPKPRPRPKPRFTG